AIHYARDGYPVSRGQVQFTRSTAQILGRYEATREAFMPGGRVPEVGEIMRLPGMAETMEAIAEKGRAGFYEGAVRDEIVRSLTEAGGDWQASDLSNFHSEWNEPISTDYR